MLLTRRDAAAGARVARRDDVKIRAMLRHCLMTLYFRRVFFSLMLRHAPRCRYC